MPAEYPGADEARARVAEIVARIVAEARRQHRQAKTRPLGARRILRQSPYHRPSRVARSPAPRFHTATWPIRRMLEQMYRAFRGAYREAMEGLMAFRLETAARRGHLVCLPRRAVCTSIDQA